MEPTATTKIMELEAGWRLKLLLKPEESADALGVSRSRIYELMADGSIRSLKLGRARRIPASELERFIERQLALQSA